MSESGESVAGRTAERDLAAATGATSATATRLRQGTIRLRGRDEATAPGNGGDTPGPEGESGPAAAPDLAAAAGAAAETGDAALTKGAGHGTIRFREAAQALAKAKGEKGI